MRKGTGISFFAGSRLGKKGTHSLRPGRCVVLHWTGKPTLGRIVFFLGAKEKVLTNRPGVLVVRFVVPIIVTFVVSIASIIGSTAVLVIVVVIIVGGTLFAIGKGSLDLFQSRANSTKTHGRLNLLQGFCGLDIILGGINSWAVDMIGVLLFRILLFLLRALLDPVPTNLANPANISLYKSKRSEQLDVWYQV